MIATRSLLLLAVLFATTAAQSGSVSSTDGKLTFKWLVTATTLEIEMTSLLGEGWFSWGISGASTMANTDIFWVKYDTVNGVEVADAFADSSSSPVVDTIQNLNVLQTTVNGSVVTVEAFRMHSTGDTAQDIDVKTNGDAQYLLYAYNQGDIATNFSGLAEHTHSGSVLVNFVTPCSKSEASEKDGSWKAHGWLMFTAWAVLFPGSVFSLRFLKSHKHWFRIYAILLLVAVAVSAIGIIIGLSMVNSNFSGRHKEHGIVGVIILACSCCYPVFALLRPNFSSKHKKTWFYVQMALGVLLVVLSTANVIVGIGLYRLNAGLTIGAIVWYVVLVASFVAAEFLRKKHPTALPAVVGKEAA